MSIIKDAKVRKIGGLVPYGEFHYVLDLTVEMPEVGAKTVTLKIDSPNSAELYLHLDPEDVLAWVADAVKFTIDIGINHPDGGV